MKEFSISGYFNVIIEAESEEEAIAEFEIMQISQIDKVDVEEVNEI